jgi:hypothetical protein
MIGIKSHDGTGQEGGGVQQLKGVVSVCVVTGRYDLIVTVLLNDAHDLLQFYNQTGLENPGRPVRRDLRDIQDVQSQGTIHYLIKRGDPMAELLKTVLHERHTALGATMVDFGGWHMPIQYRTGIVGGTPGHTQVGRTLRCLPHGRFIVRGPGALPFLQHVLSNNAAALDTGFAHYTMIPQVGGAPSTTPISTGSRRTSTCWWSNAANREPTGTLCTRTSPIFPVRRWWTSPKRWR